MPQDISQILSYAEKGNSQAQYMAGVCYHTGRSGAEKDYAKAAEWYSKAAKQGHVKAALYLGNLYQAGKGVEQNYELAAEYYRKSSDGGNDNAKIYLGMLFEKGLGVPQSYEEAAYLYHDAAENGNSKAKELLDKLLDEHDNEKSAEQEKQNVRYIPGWLKISGIVSGVVALISGIAFLAWYLWPVRKLEISDIAEKVMPATVLITVETNGSSARGSGFFTGTGQIFTNSHVIHNAKSITVKTHNGKTYSAEVLDENKDLDIAVLTVNADRKDYSVLSFAKDIPAHGSGIVVIGSPLGYEQTVSGGLVSAVRRYDNNITVLQITAPISPGSSGSPVMNMRGEVVGIATMTNTAGQSLNFAVSPLSIKRNLQANEIYLVEENMPIAENDRDIDTLRINKSSPLEPAAKSPENEKARVIDTMQLEVRTLAKVRGLSSKKTYWIDSSSVKKPVEITFEEFIEKFNDVNNFGTGRISSRDFYITDKKASLIKGMSYIQLDFAEKNIISEVSVMLFEGDMREDSIHPWIENTINIFYPVPIISSTEFYRSLTRFKDGSMTGGNIVKFPINFMMVHSPGFAMLLLELNGKSRKATQSSSPPQESTKASAPPETPIETPEPSKPAKKKKTSLRDPEYLNEIRAAIKGMPDIKEDIFQGMYFYHPQKYSVYVSRLNFNPYVGHDRENGLVTLRLSIGFEDGDWVFTNKIIFNFSSATLMKHKEMQKAEEFTRDMTNGLQGIITTKIYLAKAKEY